MTTARPAARSNVSVRLPASHSPRRPLCAHVDGRIVAGVIAALDAEPLQVRKPAVRDEVIVRPLAASQPRKVLPQRVIVVPRVCHGSAQKHFVSVTPLITLAAAIRDHGASAIVTRHECAAGACSCVCAQRLCSQKPASLSDDPQYSAFPISAKELCSGPCVTRSCSGQLARGGTGSCGCGLAGAAMSPNVCSQQRRLKRRQ